MPAASTELDARSRSESAAAAAGGALGGLDAVARRAPDPAAVGPAAAYVLARQMEREADRYGRMREQTRSIVRAVRARQRSGWLFRREVGKLGR